MMLKKGLVCHIFLKKLLYKYQINHKELRITGYEIELQLINVIHIHFNIF